MKKFSKLDKSRRYLRQEEFISPSEKKKLAQSRILLAGCGAGSTLAPNLARIGYATSMPGMLIFADPDRVDVTNLNRQFFPENSVGKNKAEALRDEVLRINSQVKTRVVREGVTLKNVTELISQADIIVDMVDIGRPKYMLALHREAQKQTKPVITGFDLGDGTSSLVYDYKGGGITLDKLLGLEKITLEELSQFPDTATIALAAQCLIGPVAKVFAGFSEVREYYMSFFNSPRRVNELKAAVPVEMHRVIDKIITGELDYIPQTNTASVSLGNIHEAVIRNLILGNEVKSAPEIIYSSLKELIINKTGRRRRNV